jgi:hypothetical protein
MELLFGWVFIVQNRKAICAPGIWQGALDVTPAPAPTPTRLRIRGNLWAGLVLCGCVREILKAQPVRPATPPPGAGTGKHQHTHPPKRYPVRLAPAPAAPLSLLPSPLPGPPLTYPHAKQDYTALNTYPNPRGGPATRPLAAAPSSRIGFTPTLSVRVL